MIRVAFALCALVFSGVAQAHGAGKMTGMWRVHQITEDGKTRGYPESFSQADPKNVWGRVLFVFDDEVVTIASQIARREAEDVVERGSKRTRDARYTWCQNQATVPVNWVDGHDPALPETVSVSGSGSRAVGKGKVDAACDLDLRLGALVQVDNAAGLPKGATTLANKDETIVIVLVPDGRPAEIKDFIDGQTELR